MREVKKEPSDFLGDFINGQFILGEASKAWEVMSPADLEDQVVRAQSSFSHLDQAVFAARKAFPSWSGLSFEKRKEKLLRLKEIFERNIHKTASIVSRETGKPLWESTTEAKALASKVSLTLEQSIQWVKEREIPNALPGGVNGFIFYKPRGVLAVLGPFNFPAHLPNGHIVPALLMGNTVLFKPSEKTPLTGQWLTQMIGEAGFPEGVFNLLQGDFSMGEKIVKHRDIDALLFTGSYNVGRKIKEQILDHHWKLLALEMGGKNTSIVWKDASLEKALYENILGAFLTSGQRCSATSQMALHEDIFDEFVDGFQQLAQKIKIGYWKDSVFMGSLIDEAAFKRHFKFQSLAQKEGGEIILEGKSLELKRRGYYVSPSLVFMKSRDKKSSYQQSEIFTPSLAFYKISDFEEGIRLFHASGYGLSLSIFSKTKSLYQKALREARAGLIHWNKSTSGASARLPFGGRGKSGNDRPAGDFSIQYCSVPVASLQDESPLNPESFLPGINFSFKKRV